MKILFITDGLYPFVLGGMQKHATYVLKNFANSEHSVTVVTTAAHEIHENDLARELFEGSMPDNIEFHFVPFPRIPAVPGHYILASWIYAKRVGKTWSQRLKEFDVIYSKGFSSWYILSTRREQHPPIVVQLHGLEMFQPAYTFKDRLVKMLLRLPAKSILQKADYIFSYGGKIRELLLGLGKKPQQILEQYGAVDDYWIHPEPSEKPREPLKFLFVARAEFRKGYHILRPVLQKLLAAGYGFEMDLVGEIPEALHVKNPAIRYHGNLRAEQIKLLMESCAAVVLPSLAEGFPTILIEAMARGLVPIATDVGAVSAVVNTENGWLIDPGSEAALENAMLAAMQLEPASLTKKQTASREMVLSRFNWKYMHKALVSHLLQILHDHRQRASR